PLWPSTTSSNSTSPTPSGLPAPTLLSPPPKSSPSSSLILLTSYGAFNEHLSSSSSALSATIV
ncbi:hypothetical protein Ancab_014457, partial [Ancistrocladus abbreviatus]